MSMENNETIERNQAKAPESADDALLMLMRRCGHHLHHNVRGNSVDAKTLLAVLSEEEKQQLTALLKKCVDSWKQQ